MNRSFTSDDRIWEWLRFAVSVEASDLHLVCGHPPVLRLHGKLLPMSGTETLQPKTIVDALNPLLSDDHRDRLERFKNLDFAMELPIENENFRFRVNLFLNQGCHGACIRIIPNRIPDFAWTTFPEVLGRRIASMRSGLVLFSGVTGAGKSTSLAMIIELLNQEGGYRILTIEDPIEYRFPFYSHSIVTQREVGVDVDTFADGLRFGLRQDPDVLFVGEIRDYETARMALSAAETGHLVLSTLHTRDAKGAISRYSDLFPQAMQSEVRAQLASNLRAVLCQRLLPSSIAGEKQELALEIMFNTSPIASSIRSGKLESIDNYILTGRSDGMISMDESIKRLLNEGRISVETAESFLVDRTPGKR